MRYAILSDIHGNLEALEAVIADCKCQKVDTVLCAGDIIGYGTNPKECIEILQKYKVVCVAGNNDWAVSGRLDATHFTPDEKAAIMWTRDNLPFEYYNYLNALELILKNKDFILAHSTLHNPKDFHYMDDISKAPDTFYLMDNPVCFVGHTHVPKIFIQQGSNIFYSNGLDIEVNPTYKYVVNAGSVGQPRDGNPMASYCIYDTKMKMIENKRVRYDVAAAQQKILAAGLPEFLAQRLAVGE